MERNVIETILGGVVLLIAGMFLVFAYANSDLRPVEGYRVIAKFNAIDGLTVGNDVRIGGVKVGTVVGQRVDQEDYLAIVTMTIRPDIKLPKNTRVAISSDGLLGGKYVKLEPSTDGDILAAGGELTSTRDVISLEELLGKVIFLVTDDPGAGS
jgi:phospholipid/cholesterol/gamma-HCH transport system substrate-binding protein